VQLNRVPHKLEAGLNNTKSTLDVLACTLLPSRILRFRNRSRFFDTSHKSAIGRIDTIDKTEHAGKLLSFNHKWHYRSFFFDTRKRTINKALKQRRYIEDSFVVRGSCVTLRRVPKPKIVIAKGFQHNCALLFLSFE
jgi:hypothetical protein